MLIDELEKCENALNTFYKIKEINLIDYIYW